MRMPLKRASPPLAPLTLSLFSQYLKHHLQGPFPPSNVQYYSYILINIADLYFTFQSVLEIIQNGQLFFTVLPA